MKATQIHSGRPANLIFRSLPARPKRTCQMRVFAVAKSDLDELELHIAVLKQKMMTAAQEDRFQDAAQFRDHLQELELKQRCLQVEHVETLRAGIRHRLGQVFKHRRYDYRGVIYGVHAKCAATENWIQSMGVDRLPHGRDQPFYHVLVDERDRPQGTATYVAQENIAPLEDHCEEAPISHQLLSQLFLGYDKAAQQYIPSKKLIAEFPDCLEAREGNEPV